MSRFEELLKELGQLLQIPLHLDKHGACKLNIKNALQVQLECDTNKERLLIASFLGELPPGAFRISVLKEALKYNITHPRTATLAYSERNNQLALFDYLHLPDLDGQKLAQYLDLFINQANRWREALRSGSAASAL